MVVAQVIATIAIGVAGVAAFRRFPTAPLRAARRGRPRPPRLPLLLDARLVARLGARDARDVARPDGRADRRGRLLPERPGAGDRVRGALGPGAPRDADRADARLRGGPLRPGHADAEALHRAPRRALMVVAVPVLWIVMPFLIGAGLRPELPRARDRCGAARARSPPRSGSSGAGRSRSPSRSAGPGLRVIVQSDRDRRLRPAAPDLRLALGRDRRGGRDARLDGGLLRGLDGVILRLRAARTARWSRWRREGPDRLGDLAAGRRRPRVACARGGGVPPGAPARGRGRDHRRRGAGAGGLPRPLGEPVDAARRPARRRGQAPRRARARRATSSTRPGCSAAPRSDRCSGERRS